LGRLLPLFRGAGHGRDNTDRALFYSPAGYGGAAQPAVAVSFSPVHGQHRESGIWSDPAFDPQEGFPGVRNFNSAKLKVNDIDEPDRNRRRGGVQVD
jgi:hypothetical protein